MLKKILINIAATLFATAHSNINLQKIFSLLMAINYGDNRKYIGGYYYFSLKAVIYMMLNKYSAKAKLITIRNEKGNEILAYTQQSNLSLTINTKRVHVCI